MLKGEKVYGYTDPVQSDQYRDLRCPGPRDPKHKLPKNAIIEGTFIFIGMAVGQQIGVLVIMEILEMIKCGRKIQAYFFT